MGVTVPDRNTKPSDVPFVPLRTPMWDGKGMDLLWPMNRTWALFFQLVAKALQSLIQYAIAVWIEVPIGTLDGVNALFTLTYAVALSPLPWLILFVNGIRQSDPEDYQLSSGNRILFTTAPRAGDQMMAYYLIVPNKVAPQPSTPTVPDTTPTTSGGRARNFAATTSDRINWGRNLAFALTGDMSCGAWVRLNKDSVSGGVIIRWGTQSAHTGGSFSDFVLWEFSIVGASGAWNLHYLHQYAEFTAAEQGTIAAGLPNGQWFYLGFSRSAATKRVTAYRGDGTTITEVGHFDYVHTPVDGTGLSTRLLVGNTGGFDIALGGDIEEHYVWGRTLTGAEHQAAMLGTPGAANLLLACPMGTTPETDSLGNSGTVTGTTLITGH